MSNEQSKYQYSVFITENIEKEYIIYSDIGLTTNSIIEQFEESCYHDNFNSLLIGKIDNIRVASKLETIDKSIIRIETI